MNALEHNQIYQSTHSTLYASSLQLCFVATCCGVSSFSECV